MAVTCLTDGAETFTANVYLVTGRKTTLVDAGAMAGITEAITERVSTVDAVVLTHRHTDHVERLETVRAAFDPDVYAADPDADAIALEDGDRVPIGDESFEAVKTPGHAPDHLAFVGESAVFSGDIVVYRDAAFEDGSFGRTDLPGADRETLVSSLDRLRSRLPETVDALYPGHGPSYQGDVSRVIDRARNRAARGEPKYPDA